MFLTNYADIFQHKYTIITSVTCLIIPYYAWRSLFKYREQLKQFLAEEQVFVERHNCVITYKANEGISGWFPNKNLMAPRAEKIYEDLYAPVIYFIQTARHTLDVAFMLISVNLIYVELVKAKRRGVKVRILCNFAHIEGCRDQISSLIREGIEYQFFIGTSSSMDTIMHHKFMVKDYDERTGEGFLCTGSMNFTSTSPTNNYEMLVFNTNRNVVKSFSDNFEECWNDVKLDNEGLINKTILMDAQFDS
ncbi:mitochondrial cardiolipin hydrolase [Anthonomus grandis grandis]|uniref:mitochondrial cardiolipin hydrolase n=1 Tax=Anthonomus grandis grandis TaxID=2921223 RepID=UPI0021664200|nr:mitochondrial cardiolipin hydrolase [Anthonomus grandis grandis]